MNYFFTIIFILLLSNAKGQITWEFFDSWNDSLSTVRFIDNSIDENLISITNKIDIQTHNLLGATNVIRIQDFQNGDIIKETTYSIDSLIIGLTWIYTLKDENRYVIVGGAYYEDDSLQRGYFLITVWDSQLNLLSESLKPISQEENNHHLWHHSGYVKNDGNLIYIGACNFWGTGSNNIFIEMNRDGSVVQSQYMDHNYGQKYVSTISETLDADGYITGGLRNYFLDYDFIPIDTLYIDFQLHKPQSFIKILDEKHYLSTGNFDGGNSPGIFKLDKEFNIVQSFNFGFSPNIVETTLIGKGIDWYDTSSIYTGAYVSFTAEYFVLANFNKDLEPNWIKFFRKSDEYAYLPFSLHATRDGGCVIVGQKGEPTQVTFPLFGRAWVIKIDSEGNIANTDDAVSQNIWSVTVFPNPSPGAFKIDIEGVSADTRVSIINIEGREIKYFDNLNEGINHLDMSAIPAGIYVWNLIKKGAVIGNGKWVRE